VSPLVAPPDPAALRSFPARALGLAQPLYRIHRRVHGPSYYSSDGSGRFDLAAPRGTCYLATEPIGAFIEVFRNTALVAQADVTKRRLATLYVAREVILADCTVRPARAFGVTAAIHSTENYSLTQSWAAAFAQAGFGGVCYRLSHDPAQRCLGVALYGPSGASDWPVALDEPIGPELIDAAREFGILVLPTPFGD
jgi:hypothetical protein